MKTAVGTWLTKGTPKITLKPIYSVWYSCVSVYTVICMCAYLSIESPTEHGFNAIFHFCIGIYSFCVVSPLKENTERAEKRLFGLFINKLMETRVVHSLWIGLVPDLLYASNAIFTAMKWNAKHSEVQFKNSARQTSGLLLLCCRSNSEQAKCNRCDGF